MSNLSPAIPSKFKRKANLWDYFSRRTANFLVYIHIVNNFDRINLFAFLKKKRQRERDRGRKRETDREKKRERERERERERNRETERQTEREKDRERERERQRETRE